MKKIILTLPILLALLHCGSDEKKLIRPPEPQYSCEEIYEGCVQDARYAPDWIAYYGRLGRCENDFRRCSESTDAGVGD